MAAGASYLVTAVDVGGDGLGARGAGLAVRVAADVAGRSAVGHVGLLAALAGLGALLHLVLAAAEMGGIDLVHTDMSQHFHGLASSSPFAATAVAVASWLATLS